MKNLNPTTNAYAYSICPAHFFAAMLYAGLEWGVPPAQYLALQMLEYYNNKTAEVSIVEGKTDVKINTCPQTLCGIPLRLDESVPETTIELRLNGDVVHRIENLSFPTCAGNRN